jgi:hypothetical protein
VLSDGGDNASHAAFADVMTQVRSSNTVIYTVALDDPFDADADPGKLKRFADASGGEAFAPKDVAEVRAAFQKIARDVRHSYTIGFEPTTLRPGMHKLRVEARTADGRRLEVHSRTGYLKGAGNAQP